MASNQDLPRKNENVIVQMDDLSDNNCQFSFSISTPRSLLQGFGFQSSTKVRISGGEMWNGFKPFMFLIRDFCTGERVSFEASAILDECDSSIDTNGTQLFSIAVLDKANPLHLQDPGLKDLAQLNTTCPEKFIGELTIEFSKGQMSFANKKGILQYLFQVTTDDIGTQISICHNNRNPNRWVNRATMTCPKSGKNFPSTIKFSYENGQAHQLSTMYEKKFFVQTAVAYMTLRNRPIRLPGTSYKLVVALICFLLLPYIFMGTGLILSLIKIGRPHP